MGWMAHRKWKEIKQQPSMLPGPAVPGCCLFSFHFLWAIHPIRHVQALLDGLAKLLQLAVSREDERLALKERLPARVHLA